MKADLSSKNPFCGDGERWFVIQTKPREEDRVTFYLTEEGIESFYPMIEVMQFRGFRAKKRIRPMFPSYLFARFDLETKFATVRWTRGVRRILGCGDEPIPLDDGIIQFIRDRADSNGVIKVGRRLRQRDRVRIRSGPLKDLLGILEKPADDKGRVQVLLNIVGYQARVALHESLIERVDFVKR